MSNNEKIYFKKLVYFPDFRVAINIYDINRIEKIEDFDLACCTRYGICINRGFENQQSAKVQNLECWYNDEEERDKRFKNLLIEFEAIGIDVTEI